MSSCGSTPVSRIAIIGVGQVGSSAAYSIMLHSIAGELLLVDTKTVLRDGQVLDLTDVGYSCNSKTKVRAATHQEARESDIVVITAGSKYSRGETSIQHIYQKMSIIESIVKAMKPFRSDTILLIVANPVDLLTSLAYQISGLPKSQVLGSGTFLDSVRIRNLLAEKTMIAANSIDLYVVGVHGDSQVPAWSDATISGVPIDKALPLNGLNYGEISNECKKRSQAIVHAKGSTPLGIGSVVSSICSSILSDKRNVRPISYFQSEWGCCFSLPVVLGRAGIIKKIELPLNRDERTALDESIKELMSTIEMINGNR